MRRERGSAARRALCALRSALCVAWLLAALAPVQAHAQRPTLRFERLSVDEGLSQSSVLSILQDRAGFIWIGTADGLNRYDGYSVTIYRADPNDPRALSNNAVRALYEDRTGTLWVGTRNGLNRFDPASGTFTRYRHDPNDPHSLSDSRIGAITEDASGTLWVGTRNGLNRFDPATQRFRAFRAGPDAEGAALYRDREGTLWTGNTSGLYRVDPASGAFTHVVFDPSDPQRVVFAFCEDQQGILWLGSDVGLFAYDRKTGRSTHYRHDPSDPRSLGGDTIYALHVDRAGALWVGSYRDGLDRLDRSTGTFAHYRSDATNPHSLADNSVLALAEDQGGLLWIGTDNGGVSIFNPASAAFQHYTYDATQAQSFSGRNVQALAEDARGTLWVGTIDGGLNALDRSAATLTAYRHDPNNPQSIASDAVQALASDGHGVLWVGTAEGLSRLDLATKTFTTYRHSPDDPNSLSDDVVQDILVDRAGSVWVATEGGLNRLDPTSGRFSVYRHDPDDPGSLSRDDVTSLYEDPQGTLWVGTWGGGLNMLDRQSGRFRHERADAGNPAALGDDFIVRMVSDPTGGLWLALASGADYRDPAAGTFRHYRQQDGLPGSQVWCIQRDAAERIWMGSSGGLAVLGPGGEPLRIFTARDGLQSNEISKACLRSARGELIFGGANGISIFDPEAALRRPAPPPIALTALTLFSQPAQPRRNLAALPDLDLAWQDNAFTLDFAALDFADPRRNRYAYRLDGFDSAWIAAGARRSATYTNLPGGDYIFRVKAANSAGVWNEQGIALRIHITTPPWRSWWAYSLYGLICVGIVGGYVGARTRTQANKLAEQARLARELEAQVVARTEERDQFFTLSNDLFCIAGSDGYFKRLNLAWEATLGWSRDDLQAQPYLNFVHPDDHEPTLMAARYGARGKRLIAFENRYRHKDGAYRWLSWSFTMTPEQLFYGVARDVTERKQAEREQQRLSQVAEGLREVLSVINSNRPLPEILHFIVGQATRLLNVAAGQIYRMQPGGAAAEDTLYVEASLGFQEAYIGTVLQNVAHTGSYRAMRERRAVAVADTTELVETLLSQPAFGPGQRPLVSEVRERFRSLLAVPLIIGDSAYGAIALYDSDPREFTDDEIHLATAFAAQSALAIENARLREQAEQVAIAEERNRLARELHDSVTQALFSLNMMAASHRYHASARDDSDTAQGFGRIGEIAQQALKEMRLLIYQLRSPVLEHEGLVAALRQRLDLVERRAGISTRLVAEDEVALDAATAEQVYGAAQEVLNNVLKHAQAREVVVRVTRMPTPGYQGLQVEIRDDGVGFDTASVEQGLGIKGMRERVAKAGGQLNISSAAGAGTVVTISVPGAHSPRLHEPALNIEEQP